MIKAAVRIIKPTIAIRDFMRTDIIIIYLWASRILYGGLEANSLPAKRQHRSHAKYIIRWIIAPDHIKLCHGECKWLPAGLPSGTKCITLLTAALANAEVGNKPVGKAVHIIAIGHDF